MDKACQVSYWYSTQQCFLKIWFICTFSYPPRDVEFLTGGKCASLLHWNLTIPPSLWPDRELRKYHCPCLVLTPPPVAIRHLLLRNRYRPEGLHGVQSKVRPNRNVSEEWVFSFQGTSGLLSLQSKFNKNPPISCWPCRRTLVVLAGLPAVRFDFSVFYTAGLRQKNTPLVSQRVTWLLLLSNLFPKSSKTKTDSVSCDSFHTIRWLFVSLTACTAAYHFLVQ